MQRRNGYGEKGDTVLQTQKASGSNSEPNNTCSFQFAGLPEDVDLVVTASDVPATFNTTHQTLTMHPAGPLTVHIGLYTMQASRANISVTPNPAFVAIHRDGVISGIVTLPSASKGMILPCASFTVTVTGYDGLPAKRDGRGVPKPGQLRIPVCRLADDRAASLHVERRFGRRSGDEKVATNLQLAGSASTVTVPTIVGAMTQRFTFGP